MQRGHVSLKLQNESSPVLNDVGTINQRRMTCDAKSSYLISVDFTTCQSSSSRRRRIGWKTEEVRLGLQAYGLISA